MQHTAPSIKRLISTFSATNRELPKKRAECIRAIIKAPDTFSVLAIVEQQCPRTWGWTRKCWNSPPKLDIQAHALDELLDTHGVEYIFRGASKGEFETHPGDTNQSPLAIYCNMGDPYVPTLLYYHHRWDIGNWGWVVESNS